MLEAAASGGRSRSAGWSWIRLRMALLLGSAVFGILALLVLDAWAAHRDARILAQLEAGPRASLAHLRSLTALYAQELPAALAQAGTDGERERALAQLGQSADRAWRALQGIASDATRRELLLQIAESRLQVDAALRQLGGPTPAGSPAALDSGDRVVVLVEPVLRRLRLLDAHEQAAIDRVIADRQALARRDAWMRWAMGLLGLLLVLGLGLRLAWVLVGGIEQLNQTAERLRERDFRPYPLIASRGELGEVIRAFDGMRAELLRYGNELRASELRANRANRAKSGFLAAMSHELRTPMVGITGMIEVLGHTRLDAEQRRALALVRHSADGLLQIVGDILDFSRIEAGKLDLAPVPVDLAELAGRCAEHFAIAASSKGLLLEASIDPALAEAHLLDPLRLRQILNNLLSNAIKFTERGRIELQVEVLAEEAAGQRLRLAVSDTGIGIAPELQDGLFEAFSQAAADVPRRFGGSGLGLAICARLASLMGGRIQLRSEPGAGSCFSIELSLPRARQADIPIEPSKLPAPSIAPLPSAAEAEATRSLVLLADDHPTNRLVVARLLALAGIRCEAVADGEAALAAWRSGRFALVLTDLNMPRLDGFGLVRALRAEEAATAAVRTPVIALTASVQKGEAERCVEAGMDDYIAKPAGVEELGRRLRPWLGAGVADPPPQAAVAPASLAPRPEPAVQREFLASCAEDLALALAQLDAPELLARQAHRIRGASMLVGAGAVASAAARLERRADSASSAERLAALLALAETVLAHARSGLRPEPSA